MQIGFGDSGGVGNCTLEDIDTVCIEFLHSELYNTHFGIAVSYNTSHPNIDITSSYCPEKFNCILSQNQE